MAPASDDNDGGNQVMQPSSHANTVHLHTPVQSNNICLQASVGKPCFGLVDGTGQGGEQWCMYYDSSTTGSHFNHYY